MDGNFRGFVTVGDGATGSIKRDRTRDSLFLRADLQFGDEPGLREVRVRNLSEGGMMAEVDRHIPTGTAVAITVRGVGRIAGHVAWCAEKRIGISFDSPIDPKRARKPVGTGVGNSDYARPSR